MAEWSKAPDLRPGGEIRVGSNPTGRILFKSVYLNRNISILRTYIFIY